MTDKEEKSSEKKKLVFSTEALKEPQKHVYVFIEKFFETKDPNCLCVPLSHFRTKGQNDQGYSVGMLGREMYNSSTDTELLHDFGICCYYSGDYKMSYRMNTLLFEKPETLENPNFELFLKNFQFTIDKLLTPSEPTFSLGMKEELKIPVLTKGFHSYNPSIIEEDDGYLMILRSGNYNWDRVNGRWLYDKTINTVNQIVRLPKSFGNPECIRGEESDEKDKKHWKELSNVLLEDVPPKVKFWIGGMEDCRVFHFRGEKWITYSSWEEVALPNVRVVLGRLKEKKEPVFMKQRGGGRSLTNESPKEGTSTHAVVGESGYISERSLLGHPPIESYKTTWEVDHHVLCHGFKDNDKQKNWISVVKGEELFFIYSFCPFILLKCNPETGKCTVAKVRIPKTPNRWRGSSRLVKLPESENSICIVHESFFPKYVNRFVLLSPDLEILGYSDPFYFIEHFIEFCCGLALSHDKKHLVICFGKEDAQAFRLVLPIEKTLATITHKE